jgi:hypothetical protein
MANDTAESGDRSCHRPGPVGILCEHDRGATDPRGSDCEGAVLGESEHGHSSAGPGRSERQAAQSEIPHSKDGDVVARIERHHVRRQSAAGLELDDGVLLTRNDMGRSHDEIGPRGPAGPLHSDVASRSEDAHHTG